MPESNLQPVVDEKSCFFLPNEQHVLKLLATLKKQQQKNLFLK